MPLATAVHVGDHQQILGGRAFDENYLGLNTPFAEVQPSISPDGRYIACMTESEGAEDIRLYDVVEKRVIPLPGVNDPRAFEQYPVLADRPTAIRL